MLTQDTIKQIRSIWDNYNSSDKVILDNKGKELPNIDIQRIEAIGYLQGIISQFQNDEIDIREFKTSIDSYNKRNNLWGFTAIKGQMFFNLLVRTAGENLTSLTKLIQEVILLPGTLNEAVKKIKMLESYCLDIRNKATDKRKVPNSSSVGYFLSYFWSIADYSKWPIYYTSQLQAYEALNIWEDKNDQQENYKNFYNLNEEIKSVLSDYSKQELTNWDVEHAFWNYNGNPKESKAIEKITPIAKQTDEAEPEVTTLKISSSFALSDYLIPKVAKLVELGAETEKSASAKGSAYEKLVAEIFKQLDFDVEILGQGSGRNPDAILRFREENTAFIVDAKAYSNGYSMGVDDRAIREYINHYCPKLQKEGYKKIGFIIVSNSFKSNFESFVNEITWNTDIKRFILLSSEALLYLLAYKTKDRLGLSNVIESLISFSNPVVSTNIIAEFDDV
ncbi:restriction endonuclease FokI C-terminal domain-containing protein [Plebeiibacterium marinum]|uniref:Restriction endonuclease n=1 Tax=Plebeiibacterium marinum TaxID=2992111 RepID=A0AAE3MDI1_9BACT|nr:restriction endonuclease FokI C-terminal domain-containing protein [Plebeiobacterium marinum]MCW3805729.1 restriction endonuclease [Plebeiobacterium marinum]